MLWVIFTVIFWCQLYNIRLLFGFLPVYAPSTLAKGVLTDTVVLREISKQINYKLIIVEVRLSQQLRLSFDLILFGHTLMANGGCPPSHLLLFRVTVTNNVEVILTSIYHYLVCIEVQRK